MAPSNQWLLSVLVILCSLLFYLIFIYTMALEFGGWRNLEISDFFGLIIFLPFSIGMFLCMYFAKETRDQLPIKKDHSDKAKGKFWFAKTFKFNIWILFFKL